MLGSKIRTFGPKSGGPDCGGAVDAAPTSTVSSIATAMKKSFTGRSTAIASMVRDHLSRWAPGGLRRYNVTRSGRAVHPPAPARERSGAPGRRRRRADHGRRSPRGRVDVGRDRVDLGGREADRHHADEAREVGDAQLRGREIAAARRRVMTRERVAAGAGA